MREWYALGRVTGRFTPPSSLSRPLVLQESNGSISDRRCVVLSDIDERLMPRVSFESLPDDARVWVFGAARELDALAAERLLGVVDDFLAQWNAHGSPLVCGRDWRDDRFLAIGVDQSTAGASGCSIDGLFRALARLEPELGTSLLGGGRVYYRDAEGRVAAATRSAFHELARDGSVGPDTPVFDTSLTSASVWRDAFERPVRDSWHKDLLTV
jgi:hypothetical protein